MAAAIDIMNAHSYDAEKVSEDHKSDYDLIERGDIYERAYELCKQYLKGRWETVPRSDFQVSVLGGGLTNKLYICRIPAPQDCSDENIPHIVVLRIYGLIIQDFTAQIQESVVFSILSERGIGPRLFAVFPGGRLEEYIQCRTLATDDLPDPVLSSCIASKMAKYHAMVMPVNKQPTTVMNKLELYYGNLHNVQFDDDHKSELLSRILQYDFGAEIEYIKDLIDDTASPVVFCHNDVQEGNLLYVSQAKMDDNPIQMIDFEYSCYNYRGFDFGNHFCEWTFDYSHPKWPFFAYKPENYPSKQQQEIFIKSYLEEHLRNPASRRGDKWQVNFIIKEANRFALLSHLFWSLWSVIQAKMSDIGFGYMEYALTRMEAYYQLKNLIE